MSGLPGGTYTFYFAVDTNMNGLLDSEEVFFDSVIAAIVVTNSFFGPAQTSGETAFTIHPIESVVPGETVRVVVWWFRFLKVI